MTQNTRHRILAAGIAATLLTAAFPVMADTLGSDAEVSALILSSGPVSAEYKTKDLDTEYDSSATEIKCGNAVEISGSGAEEVKGIIAITKPGTYILSGSYTGQLVVNASQTDYVHIILNGFTISSNMGPAIYAKQCDKLTITLADGTENSVTDSEGYNITDEDGTTADAAAILSDEDMSLNGTGSLTVTGKCEDGIRCNKDLKLISGTYTINVVSEGLKGKNSVVIREGSYDITSGDTAIKATKDTEAEKGYVIIDGGAININAGNDGIHAETHLTINGGSINIENSSEGLEGQMIDIIDGTLSVTASDDGINASRIGSTSDKGGFGGRGGAMPGANPSMTWEQMKGMRNMNGPGGGEGVSFAGKQKQNHENTNMLQESDNPAQPNGGRPMGGGFVKDDGQVYINISGGTVTVYGDNDCIDSNGSICLSGGSVYASSERYGITGPEAVLDADGAIELKEGITFIGTGSGSAIGLKNEQNSIYVYESEQQSKGTAITLKNSSGETLASYTPDYGFSAIAISSPEIKTGESYTLSVGSNTQEITVSDQETTVGTPLLNGRFPGMGHGSQLPDGMEPGKNDTRGNGTNFTDINRFDYYYRAVRYFTDNNIINGITDTTFEPETALTRAMAVTILGRYANANADASSDNTSFNDVSKDLWYSSYVAWAVENGIVNGYDDTTFAPDDYITSEQLQLIIERFADYLGHAQYTKDTTADNTPLRRCEFAHILYTALNQIDAENMQTTDKSEEMHLPADMLPSQ